MTHMNATEVVDQWIESNGYEDMGMDPGELLDALKDAGWLFTPEDARLFRLAIDWIASELRDQDIPPSEYLVTRTFLNEMITRFDQYAAITGSETPWSQT